MTEDWRAGGFGLYLHWPYCEAKCPYCDFNSHVARTIDHSRWNSAYLEEIDAAGKQLPDRVLNSIFFGGGTPSLMEPETVGNIISKIRKTWPVANDLEITLEANPSSVEAGRFAAFSDAGVNRISMGVQALNDLDLRRLGRLHTVAEAQQAFDIARKYFDRVSFDLIYARQDQTLEDWHMELTEALSMAVDHLSLYQLTIEQGTAFGDRYARGTLHGLPAEDSATDMFELTQELCEAAGMPAYEVSNHARAGTESRHNLIYWRYGDYLGIGPGAHGRITLPSGRFATVDYSMPEKWLNPETRHTPPEQLTRQDQAAEYLMMGLRLTEGIDRIRYENLADQQFCAETVSHLVELGMIRATPDRIQTTMNGRAVLNSVIEALLP